MGAKVLIVDDEPSIRFGIRAFLSAHGFVVDEADSCASAQRRFRTFTPDAVILDYRLPDGVALDLLHTFDSTRIPVLILTAHATIDLAVRLTKEGAEQFLTKPVELDVLLDKLEQSLEATQRRRPLRVGPRTFDPFVGTSDAIQRLRAQAERVRQSESPTLVTGETGTGKSVLARWIHNGSSRKDHAFVDLNCAGLSKDFLDTELFGHEKGAFTGAMASKQGLLDVGHKGTLFLDEIGDVDLSVQPKLLKVLEEGRFRRMGDVRDRVVDVRLLAATHQDLSVQMQAKQFRSDLYFRLSTLLLDVPPLRERREDILLLARAILDGTARPDRGSIPIDRDAERILLMHPWPGNIRQLRNVMERALYMGGGDRIAAEHLVFEPIESLSRIPLPAPGVARSGDAVQTLESMEKEHIVRALAEEGHVEAAARKLGVPRSSLYQKLKRFGIAIPRRS
jgi:DNA-binding NtrC family response regulator